MIVDTRVVTLQELKKCPIYLQSDVQFVIPSIQRSYQWCIGHDSKEGLNDSAFAFIEDLIRFNDTADRHDEPYFLGTFIVYNSKEGNVDIMDGQQRWTTLTALMAAIYHVLDGSTLENTTPIQNEIKEKFLVKEDGLSPLLKSKVDLDNEMLEALINLSGDIDLEDDDAFIAQWDGNGMYRRGGKLYTGRSLYVVTQYFVQRLKDEFDIAGPLSTRKGLMNFYKNIASRVMINLTLSKSSRLAYRMFITANARGTPLTNFDILRGLILARNQAITGEENNSEFNGIFGVAEHFLNEIVDGETSPNDAIDKLIADALGIHIGERISKASVLGHLEDEISGFEHQEQLLRFAKYFMKYVTSYRTIQQFTNIGGMNLHSFICYASPGKRMPQHTVLFTAARVMDWTPAELKILLRTILCFFVRTDICTKTATKKWYSVIPSFGNSILNPSGESRRELVQRLADSFSKYPDNPNESELKESVHRPNFSVTGTALKNRMIALFYALEEVSYIIKKGQAGVGKAQPLMPYFQYHLRSHYQYGSEQTFPGKFSKTLGNIFLLNGTQSDISNISESPSAMRIGSFYEKSGVYDTSDYWLGGRETWGHQDIRERTDWLAELIDDHFPQSCWKDDWIE